jgi:L-asparagine transporter-like permease
MYSVKLVSVVTLFICFILLRANKYIHKLNPRKYYGFIVSILIVIGILVALIVLISKEEFETENLEFISLSYFDFFLIITLTAAVIFFRYAEQNMLVDI